MPKKKKRIEPLRPDRTDLWIGIGLAAAVLAVYSQVARFDFVTFDDPVYVTENPHVQAGLTWNGVIWAFTSGYGGNWNPVTWLSHMLDCQFFGLDPAWPHLLNAIIHAINTVLWFVVLKRLTGSRWKSAMVAFLFGLHPLHVESVAWVCERKDVLSAFFWVVTVWAYARYAKRPKIGKYLVVMALFCLGLMTKPMLVTLPIVLLLLDQWPLARGIRLLEKVPLLVASLAASVITFAVHQSGEALPSFALVPLAARIENALISYTSYVLSFFWPANLAVFYPYRVQWMVPLAAASGAGLLAISALVGREFRRRPYLVVGWFWYLIALLPVIGIVQAGAQARADRFTYIPMVGLTIALVWWAAELLQPWPRTRTLLAMGWCGACVLLTWIQLGFWQDSVTLYTHAIEATSGNYVAQFNLASVLETRGDLTGAVSHLRETVLLRPYFATAHAELGQILAKQGESLEALAELETAVKLRPDVADAHFRLGAVFGALGRDADAVRELSEGVRLEPGNAGGHFDLAIGLAQTGRLAEAVTEFQQALRLKPQDADARFTLAIALVKLRRVDEAVQQLQEAIRIRPGFADAQQALEQLAASRPEKNKK